MQLPLFSGTEKAVKSPFTLPLPEAHVRYYPQWLTTEQANLYKKRLVESLPWRQDSLRMFGKSIRIPRLQSWHGDANCHYTYSGLSLSPAPWTKELAAIRDLCSAEVGAHFNSVLANWYRDGQDSMSMHADDEPELGPAPTIASVTLGEARPFVFKHKETKARHVQVLEHGSLLVMSGSTQHHYFHGITKTTKPIGDRINLTYRQLILPD